MVYLTMVNVGKYTIHGWFRVCRACKFAGYEFPNHSFTDRVQPNDQALGSPNLGP